MGHLVKKLFGIYVPPFKRTVFKSKGALSIYFVLSGPIPSKKNQKMAYTERKEGFKIIKDRLSGEGMITKLEARKIAIDAVWKVHSKIVANEHYKKFLAGQKETILRQMAFWSGRFQERGLIFPLEKASLSMQLHFKGRYVTDTINKLQTLQDLLVDCGVITDDNYKVLNPIHAESACYYEEIVKDISKITLTLNL